MTDISYRHIILSLILTCLLTACNSQDPQEESGATSMIFSAELGSRANIVGDNNITAYPFAVYSDMISMNRTPESDFITIHDATEVSYSNSDKRWSYVNTQYWFPGYQYSFVALHPADAQYVSGVKYRENCLKFTYTQPLNYKNASDLLISAHRRDYAGGSAEAVNFHFAHILTNVNVAVTYRGFSSGPSRITITDLTFRNVPTKSTYSISPAPLTGDSKMTSDWVNNEGSFMGWTVNTMGDMNVKFSAGEPRIVQANKDALQLFSSSDALLLLPNPYDQDSPAEVELNYETDKGEKESVSAVIPSGWSPGTNLNLSLEIDNGKVQFGISVEEWKTADVGSTTNTTVPRK